MPTAPAAMPPSPPPRFDADQIRDYYERHTAAFLARGQGGAQGAIRRAVWGPGVRTRDAAFRYVDDRIGEALDGLAPAADVLRVVDLGCGVGASLCHVAAGRALRGTGLTLSPAQAALAARRIADLGLADRVRCDVADFCAPPDALAGADAAWAIEAFVHAPSAGHFFSAAARLVRPGGLLLVCDDFAGEASSAPARAARERVCRGWRLNTLVSLDQARAAAAAAGFAPVRVTRLTPWLELDRPRDRALAALALALDRVPAAWRRWGPLLGGNALRRGLARGWLEYALLELRRTE